MPRRLTFVVAALLLCVVAACSNESGGDEPAGTGGSGAEAGSDDGQSAGGGSDEAGEPDTQDDPLAPSAAEPAKTVPLDWRTRPLSDKGIAAATRKWTGAADSLGKRVTITSPTGPLRFKVSGGRVQALEMQWPWAAVYAGGALTGPQSTRGGQIAVFDLRTGERRMVGTEGSAPKPAASGAISMYDGRLAYASGTNKHYCLAQLSLDTLDGDTLDCAKPLKEGFTQFRLTPAGFGYTSFDDRRPSSCMTLKSYYENQSHTLEAPKECIGWEVVPGEDSELWLQVRDPNRVERARAYARGTGGKVENLGPALSGSTTWCGGSTYFLRPAEKDGRADDLMRWSPKTGLDLVWKPKNRKVAFVFAPHCGGSTVTLPGFDHDQEPIIMSTPVD